MKNSSEVAADLAVMPPWVRRRTEVVGECIEWTGAMTGPERNRPTSWCPDQRLITVHRHVYEIAHEVTLDRSVVVFRSCWNPRCVRVTHLVPGHRGEHKPPIVLEHAEPTRITPIARAGDPHER